MSSGKTVQGQAQAKGPWIHRFAIRFFTVLLTLLFYWLLGFVVKDIRNIKGPDYDEIGRRHIDSALSQKNDEQVKQLQDINRQIEKKREKQKNLETSTRNLQGTIAQLNDQQKLSLEKNIELSEDKQKIFTDSMNQFLQYQQDFQTINQEVADLTDQKNTLEDEKRLTDTDLQTQRNQASQDYQQQMQKHRMKLALLQLIVLVPILLLAAFLIAKKREHIYFPLFLAFGSATLIQVSLVIHRYFPSWIFKYALILVLLAAVIKLLSHFIKSIAFPKTSWLIKQYREAYERFLCPACEYPIRQGPLRFLFWNRRSIKKLRVRPAGSEDAGDYTCPACGTHLFGECDECHKTRYILLPYCNHCGAEKTIRDEPSS